MLYKSRSGVYASCSSSTSHPTQGGNRAVQHKARQTEAPASVVTPWPSPPVSRHGDRGASHLQRVHQHQIPEVSTLQHQKKEQRNKLPRKNTDDNLAARMAEGKHEVQHDGPAVEEHDCAHSSPVPGEPNHRRSPDSSTADCPMIK